MHQRILIACSSGVFLSAGLVFLIQPLFARLLLPEFGGSPSVWNACTVFFQTMLLCGYCYTWLSTSWLSPKNQIVLHLVVLLLTLLQLPIGLQSMESLAPAASPALRLLVILTVSIGGPYFAVSTTTPLLQHWFSMSSHRLAGDPYFFYSISNAGSILGLLAYPFVVERLLVLESQQLLWSSGYAMLVGVTMLCGLLTLRWPGHAAGAVESVSPKSRADRRETREDLERNDGPVTGLRRLRWAVLALVPSAMMLAVTTRVTTDVAAVPLLWVLPLVAYLATFINAFARRPWLKSERLVPLLFPALLMAAWVSLVNPGSHLRAGVEILVFLMSGIVLHGELAADRPATRFLTEFYFWIALGGCLGGMLVGLIAPMVFPSYIEFPLVVVLAALTQHECPNLTEDRYSRFRKVLSVLAIFILCGSAMVISLWDVWSAVLVTASQLAGFAALGVFFLKGHVRGVALSLALVLIPPSLVPSTNSLARKRTFFGVHEVTYEEDAETGIRVHQLAHGTTVHGEQIVQPAQLSCEPRTYYVRTGPIGEALTLALKSQAGGRVAIVGLGTGALMAYSQEDDFFDFYEIDPAVRDLAENPDLFSCLSCGDGEYRVIVGDGRLKLAEVDEATYDVIVLDAFGSDSIPIHLLTADAIDMFMSRLKNDGTLIIHISNRHIDLEPVLGRYASERELPALVCMRAASTLIQQAQGQRPTHAVVISKSASLRSELEKSSDWHVARRNASLWTDSYSSILDVIRLD